MKRRLGLLLASVILGLMVGLPHPITSHSANGLVSVRSHLVQG